MAKSKKSKKYLIETGKGQNGSIFVWGDSTSGREIRAKRIGKTVGGLQIWEVRSYKGSAMIHLKRRTELRKAVERLAKQGKV
jgi:hypothetical protein